MGSAVVAADKPNHSGGMIMTPIKAYLKMDLTGKTFGLWKVLSFYGTYYGKAPTWTCRCRCGCKGIYNVMQCKLLKGQSLSCDDLDIRKCWIKNGVGYVPLTKGKVATISPCKIVKLQRWLWYASLLDGGWYAYRRQDGKGISMARQILGLGDPKKDKREAEHRNGKTLDNRNCNLRVSSRSQNEANKGVRRDSETGVKGVRFHKYKGEWTGRYSVRIRYWGKEIFLGMCDTLEEGAAMYAEAARLLFGKFARSKW
jgi:hypothetical protein